MHRYAVGRSEREILPALLRPHPGCYILRPRPIGCPFCAEGKAEYKFIPLLRNLFGVYGVGVGTCIGSLDETLIVGTGGGGGTSGAGDLVLPLENFSACPKLPLLRRRFEKDFFLEIAGSSVCSYDVTGSGGGVGGEYTLTGGSCVAMPVCDDVLAVCGLVDCGSVVRKEGSVRDLRAERRS